MHRFWGARILGCMDFGVTLEFWLCISATCLLTKFFIRNAKQEFIVCFISSQLSMKYLWANPIVMHCGMNNTYVVRENNAKVYSFIMTKPMTPGTKQVIYWRINPKKSIVGPPRHRVTATHKTSGSLTRLILCARVSVFIVTGDARISIRMEKGFEVVGVRACLFRLPLV